MIDKMDDKPLDNDDDDDDDDDNDDQKLFMTTGQLY